MTMTRGRTIIVALFIVGIALQIHSKGALFVRTETVHDTTLVIRQAPPDEPNLPLTALDTIITVRCPAFTRIIHYQEQLVFARGPDYFRVWADGYLLYSGPPLDKMCAITRGGL